MKTTAIAFFLGLALNGQQGLYGQKASGGPAFEVATIKPAPPITPAMAAAGKLHVGTKVDQANVDIGYTSLTELIRSAYDVKLFQISGPAWMSDQRWDILAKIPEGVPASQVPQMLQALLADRFGLKVHREQRESRVYGLEVAKDGPKLKPSPSEEAPAADPNRPLQVSTSRDGRSSVTSGAGYGITKTEMHPDGSMHMESSKMSMALLCEALAYYLDRPVVDLTQLAGNYVVELDYSAADLRFAAMKAGAPEYAPPAAAGASEPVGASLITSVQKLGLKLEAQQAPVETIVVDHLERTPREN